MSDEPLRLRQVYPGRQVLRVPGAEHFCMQSWFEFGGVPNVTHTPLPPQNVPTLS